MNQFITVTGYESQRKFRVNVNHIRTYVISKCTQFTSIQSITSEDDINVIETSEEIDNLINPKLHPYNECNL